MQTLEEVREIFEDPNGIPGIGTPAWKTHNSYKKARALEKGQLAADAEAAVGKDAGYDEKRGGNSSDESPTRG